MLQSANIESDDVLSDCAQCPTCLGNPASMLPFLTAQANSVFSMASGNKGSFPSAGGILTPSTQVLTCSEAGAKQSESVGLDLGNGWKVVGLTSLAGLPLQTSSSVQFSQSSPVNSSCSESGTQDVSNQRLITTFSESASLNRSGCFMNTTPELSPPALGEWKVVGLTPLNQGNSDVPRNSESAAVPVQNLSLPDSVSLGSDIDSSLNDPRAKQKEQCKQSDLADNLGSNFNLPSLDDIAAGTCEWKIAGVTTLVAPLNALTAPESNKAETAPTGTVKSVAQPAVAPEISLTDTAEWKIVGVTSLNPPPQNSAPIVASSNTHIPLVTASAAPAVAMPFSPSAAKDMVWKVVGTVPLQQHGETSPKNTDSQALSKHQTCNISESPVPTQSSSQESDVEDQEPIHTTSPDKECVQQLWMPSRVTDSRKLSSRCLDRHEDPNHPLGFLKNCSNQFRNAVLKRNTVSTMLELKRAYQDIDKKEKLLNFMEGVNHLSLNKNLMYFALKRLSKSAKTKSVDYVKFIEQNSDELHVPSLHQNIRKNQDNMKVGRAVQDCADDKTFHPDPPKSAKHMFVNQSTSSPVTDDKLALSMAYRTQMKPEKNDLFKEMDARYSSTPPHPHCPGLSHPHSPDQKSEEHARQVDEYQTLAGISLKTVDNEDGQSVINFQNFDSDAVNLTNVDPWGVCTHENLGEITEMMTGKGENKIHQSSSRKRKLSTPRKMIQ